MKKTVRRLAGTVLTLLALAAFVCWDNNALEITGVEFTSSCLPAAFDGLVAVQLSDFHGKEFESGNERLLGAAAAQSPDLIVVTGDLVDENTKRPLEYAASIGGALSALAPTYFVTGNHEWAARQAEDICAVLRVRGWCAFATRRFPLRETAWADSPVRRGRSQRLCRPENAGGRGAGAAENLWRKRFSFAACPSERSLCIGVLPAGL